MSTTPPNLPAIGVLCWRDRISPETGATVLNLAAAIIDNDPLLELAYDEGGSGWWPLSTLILKLREGEARHACNSVLDPSVGSASLRLRHMAANKYACRA